MERMQRGRGGIMEDFFNFDDGGFGGFGGQRSLMSSFFNKDPFDDAFFRRPFESRFGRSMFGDSTSAGFFEEKPSGPSKSKGPIIEEILSDDEEEDDKSGEKRKDDPRKNSMRSKEPYVQHQDEETEERSKHLNRSEFDGAKRTHPGTRSFSFSSSTVTYGGANGAYYTSSTTRRTGGDGVTIEERKEADSTTGRASHRISRGIRDKGHSVTRKLHPEGKVDTMQTLHNLNEDELAGFEEAWKGSARKHLPGWDQGYNVLGDSNMGASSSQNGQATMQWALPSSEQPQNLEGRRSRGGLKGNSSNGNS